MSWMDSWSRPSKSQATPPPFYLLPGGDKTPYCKSCGRVIGDRKNKTAVASATPAKYCSSRCKNARHNKTLELKIEDSFIALLNGSESMLEVESDKLRRTTTPPYKGGPPPGSAKKKKKGETRILVQCSEVENLVFGDRNADPEKRFGRRKNRARRGVKDGEVWKSVDMISDDEDDNAEDKVDILSKDAKPDSREEDLQAYYSEGEDSVTDGGASIGTASTVASEGEVDADVVARLSIRSGTRIRPSQDVSEVNGGIGGEKGVKERVSETEAMLAKRREGQKRADEREMVRCAARRGVAFGFAVNRGQDNEETRLCEAVMLGKVVESSFAKGEWGVRWRE